jgi:diguanylate cyclase (GGDEF)-like protein
MDPQTVILILALNLITIGMLLAMIGRRMDEGQGMRGFATGSVVFGAAYLMRVAMGHRHTSLLSALPDALMVHATLCYGTGLRQFVGLPRMRRRFVWACTLGSGLLSLLGILIWQDVGRHVVLNASLAAGYLAMASMAARGMRRVSSALAMSMTVIAAVIGVLGLLTAVRAVAAALWGVEPLFVSRAAQLYYAYSTLVTVVLGPNLLWMVFLRLNDRLAQLATHDPLTGLLNRNGLDEALRRHFGARPPQPLVLCQLDIDHFKRINDAHGHAAGDAVLRGVAHTLAAHVRGADFVARLGGEEFLIGCQGGHAQALALAERLRSALAAARHAVPGGGPLGCTVSIGVSQAFLVREGWEAALRDADAALYQAKLAGRNQVVATGV